MSTIDLYKPVLKGKIYCSPSCGFKCTKAEFDKATADAKAVCKTLGHGWKPHVWENLGWHYAAESPIGRVHEWSRGGAWADLNVEGHQYEADGKTPKEALDNTIAKIRKTVEKCTTFLETASKYIKK